MPEYTKADMDAVSDNPELTDEELREMVPFAQAFPDLAATIRKRGPQKAARKVSTTIRLSAEVIEHFRAGGPGWQARIDDALKAWVAAH
jgi:uncharacterized protein (DUF4415 family)